MTSPNPMALDAKAFEAATKKTPWGSCLLAEEIIRAYLATLPRPAYQIKAMPNASQYIYALFPTEAEARVQYGDGEVRPLYTSTPAARAAVLEEAALLIEESSIIHSSGPDTLRKRYDGNISGMAYAAAIRALKEKT